MIDQDATFPSLRIRPGEVWQDLERAPVQAQGGGILHHGTYYWYGDDKSGPASEAVTSRVDVVRVACYSSRDLVHWTREGLVLPNCLLSTDRTARVFRERTLPADPFSAYKLEYSTFAEAVALSQPSPALAEDALSVALVLEALCESAACGREVALRPPAIPKLARNEQDPL